MVYIQISLSAYARRTVLRGAVAEEVECKDYGTIGGVLEGNHAIGDGAVLDGDEYVYE